MRKLNSKDVGNLKLRIADSLNCSDLNGGSQTFCIKIMDRLDRDGVDTKITGDEMKWLVNVFEKHQIKHPDDPGR